MKRAYFQKPQVSFAGSLTSGFSVGQRKAQTLFAGNYSIIPVLPNYSLTLFSVSSLFIFSSKKTHNVKLNHSTGHPSPAPSSLFGLISRKRLAPKAPFGRQTSHMWLVSQRCVTPLSLPSWKPRLYPAHWQTEHFLQSVWGMEQAVQFTGLLMRAVCLIPHAMSKTQGYSFLTQEKHKCK